MGLKKKLGTVLIAAGLALGAVGCSSAGESAAEPPPAEEVAVTEEAEDESAESEEADVETEVTSAPDPNAFIAEDGGFQIAFPGTPEVEHWSDEAAEEGLPVGGSTWSYESPDGASYIVGFVKAEAGAEYMTPQAIVEEIADLTGQAVVEQDLNATFLGQPAASIETKTEDGQSIHMIAFRGTDARQVFSITTAGLDKAQFDAFVDSFQFVN